MNRQLRSLVASALALVVMVTLIGCSDTATPTAAPAAPTKAATTAAAAPTAAATAAPTAVPETIKLGHSVPLSGPAASSGLARDRFLKMAIDDVNAKGGVKAGGKTYRLESVSVDDKMTAEGGLAAANQLVLAEKVKFMFAGGLSAGAIEAVSEPNKVLLFIMGAQDRQLGPSFAHSFAAGYPNIRMGLPALYAQLTKDYPTVKRLALLYDENQRDASKVNTEVAKSYGLTVVTTEFYPTAATDFGPLVTRLLAQNPDAIDVGSVGGSTTAFLPLVKALSEQGYKKPIFGLSGVPAVLLQAGPLAEGYFFQTIADYNASVLAPMEKELIQRFIKTYGEKELQVVSLGQYASVQVLAQAMVKANTVDDTDKIAQTLREGQWDTIWGKKGFSGVKLFGLAQQLDQNVYLSKLQGGKLITYDSFNGTLP